MLTNATVNSPKCDKNFDRNNQREKKEKKMENISEKKIKQKRFLAVADVSCSGANQDPLVYIYIYISLSG